MLMKLMELEAETIMMKSAQRHDAGTGGGATSVRTMELGSGAVRAFTPGESRLTVIAISGAVWVTQTAGARDVILRGGERFTSRGAGRVVIEPITGEACIGMLGAPQVAPAREHLSERLLARLRLLFAGRSGTQRESYCN
jgi:hypothetical protein